MADRESTDKIEKKSYYFMLLLLHFCKIKHYPRTEELSISYMKNKIHFWVFWMQAESLLCSKSRMLTWKLEILRSSIPTQIVWATFNGFEAHLVKIDHFLVYSQSPVLCQFEFFCPSVFIRKEDLNYWTLGRELGRLGHTSLGSRYLRGAKWLKIKLKIVKITNSQNIISKHSFYYRSSY